MVSYEYKEGLLAKLQYDADILGRIIARYALNKNLTPVVESAMKELNIVSAKIFEIERDISSEPESRKDPLKGVFNV